MSVDPQTFLDFLETEAAQQVHKCKICRAGFGEHVTVARGRGIAYSRIERALAKFGLETTSSTIKSHLERCGHARDS